MRGPQHTYPFGSETVVSVVIKSFIAANGKIVQRTVRQLGFVDGKIVHNPTCPFGVVYTDRELSLLKTLASKVMFLTPHNPLNIILSDSDLMPGSNIGGRDMQFQDLPQQRESRIDRVTGTNPCAVRRHRHCHRHVALYLFSPVFRLPFLRVPMGLNLVPQDRRSRRTTQTSALLHGHRTSTRLLTLVEHSGRKAHSLQYFTSSNPVGLYVLRAIIPQNRVLSCFLFHRRFPTAFH